MNEEERYRKYSTIKMALKARLKGERELMCMFWGRWREIMRVWNYMTNLRHEVMRRTALVDDIREMYLKDVWTIKNALSKKVTMP